MPAAKTPAKRAREKSKASLGMPPRPAVLDRQAELHGLTLDVGGRRWKLGHAVVSDPAVTAGIDATEMWTIQAEDRHGVLSDALTDPLTGKTSAAATVTIGGSVYSLTGTTVDDTGGVWDLRFEDYVASQMRLFTKPVSFKRSSVSRTGAVLRLLQEASTPPLAEVKYWLPELADKRAVPVEHRGTGGRVSAYKVKGKTATSAQRAVIDGILTKARALGASRRVMIACLMAATQESTMGLAQGAAAGTDDVGIYQQGRPWISAAGASQPGPATEAFLVSGPTSWKKVNGSLKTSNGQLWQLIYRVQACRADLASQYGKWEAESTASVDAWLGSDRSDPDAGTSAGSGAYEFARGDQGTRETSWDATGRWASDVGAHRWAQRNVFAWVSDNELRSGRPALTIDGSEKWLLAPLGGYESSRSRPVETVVLRAQLPATSLLVGSCIDVVDHGALDGRWIVRDTTGVLVGPDASATLSRPVSRAAEPAGDSSGTRASGTGGSGAGTTSSTWAWPTSPRGRQTSGFGARSSPGGVGSTNHDGIDIGVGIGTKVVAANGGKVTVAGTNGGYGLYVELAHDGGITSFYGHLSQVKVRVGQKVDKGDVIALSGNTGHSTGPHLHYGMHKAGVRLDPSRYVH